MLWQWVIVKVIVIVIVIVGILNCFTVFAFADEKFSVIKIEKPIKVFELFEPIPELKKQTQAHINKKPAEQILEKQENLDIGKKENPLKREDTSVNKQTDLNFHAKELKKMADTKWFKFKIEQNKIIISGMTKKESVKKEMEKYCKDNNIKCNLTIVKIQ